MKTTETTWRTIAIIALIIILTIVFAVSPPTGQDWQIFVRAGERVLRGQSPYADPGFYNPPWLAVALIPLSLLPGHGAWALISALTLVASIELLRRWNEDRFALKALLVLLSPPIVYNIYHGQVDAVLLAGLFLPDACWPIVALTKPQATMGLLFGVRRENGVTAAALALLVGAASIAAFGFWPLEILNQPAPGPDGGWQVGRNLWAYLWPMQVPVGVALLSMGVERRDERLLVAASPLLVPYAATSSLIGAWIAACSWLKWWQAALTLAAWWGAVGYRALMSY